MFCQAKLNIEDEMWFNDNKNKHNLIGPTLNYKKKKTNFLHQVLKLQAVTWVQVATWLHVATQMKILKLFDTEN